QNTENGSRNRRLCYEDPLSSPVPDGCSGDSRHPERSETFSPDGALRSFCQLLFCTDTQDYNSTINIKNQQFHQFYSNIQILCKTDQPNQRICLQRNSALFRGTERCKVILRIQFITGIMRSSQRLLPVLLPDGRSE